MTVEREHRVVCEACGAFEMAKQYRGASATPGETEYVEIDLPETCPNCGAVLREVRCDGGRPGTDDLDESDDTVFVVSRSGNGGRNHIHTDETCPRLQRAKHVFEKARDLVDEDRICRVCSGEYSPPKNEDTNTNALRKQLEATAPEELGLSPLGERPGGDGA